MNTPDDDAPPAQDTYQYDAFVSCTDQDSDWVYTTLVPPLERAGLRLCMADRDFEIGVPRLINIGNAVERSRRTLLILTPNWGGSEWNEFEGLLARTGDPIGNRRRVLPVIALPCRVPAYLGYLTPLDLTKQARFGFEAQIQRLVAAIRATPETAKDPDATGESSSTIAQEPGAHDSRLKQGRAVSDGRLDYERGLRALEQYVPQDGGNEWKDFNLFKEQLVNNLSGERRYGPTAETRAERARIIDQINPLVLRLTGLSFTDLCLGREPKQP